LSIFINALYLFIFATSSVNTDEYITRSMSILVLRFQSCSRSSGLWSRRDACVPGYGT